MNSFWVIVIVIVLLLSIGCFKVLGEEMKSEDIYKYIPPPPLISTVEKEVDYVRFCREHRERAILEKYVVLERMYKILDQEKDDRNGEILIDRIERLAEEIFILQSPVKPYTPMLQAQKKFQELYKEEHKEKYTTHDKLDTWTLANGKRTSFEGVLALVTKNKVTFVLPDDTIRTVTISLLSKVDRVIVYAELMILEKKIAARRMEMILSKPDIHSTPRQTR